MFYCEDCKVKHSWPGLFKRLVINCQVCGRTSHCYQANAQDLLPDRIDITGENTIMYDPDDE